MIFTIDVTKDGNVFVQGLTEEEFVTAINTTPDDPYMGVDPIDPTQLRDNTVITNTRFWNDSSGRILAIRGAIVKAVAVTKVETWEVK